MQKKSAAFHPGKTAGRKPGPGRLRKALGHWQLYLMTLPAVIYMLIFAYKPMYGVIIAFKDYSLKKGIIGSPWVGMENFQRFFNSYWFPIILKNTLTISVLSLILSFPIPIISGSR